VSEENKALARRSWELLRNLDLIDEIYSPDLVWHEPDQDIRGVEEAKQFVGTYLSAFPDMHATVQDVIAEGDKAVTRWTIRGTHQGELMGVAPTALLRCAGRGRRKTADVPGRSDGDEFGERGRHAIQGGGLGREFVVAAP
jgi:hypothetical protein